MRKVVVAGAAGFIGSWLALELLRSGYQVTVIVRNPDKLISDIASNINSRIVKKDINDLNVEDMPSDEYDIFYNVSWAGVSSDKKDDFEIQMSNVSMQLNALRVCSYIGCKKFITTGTVAEYAMAAKVINFDERQRPNDIYGAAKIASYFILDVESKRIGQPFIWTVLPSTFGERRNDNNIITYTIKELLYGRKPCFGNLEQMWDFLYASEVARAMRLIGEKGIAGKIYGIGSGVYKPLREYICQIRDIINPSYDLGIGEIPSLSKKTFSSCVNIYDLIKDTGFYPKVSFEEGIKRTINYWKTKI